MALACAAVAIPWLTSGPDVYVHVVWSHQVLRSLASGELPVWLPDLNAGCGSPGVRLYSPGGPLLSGALAVIAGDACTGIRLALVLALGSLFFFFRRRSVEAPGVALGLVMLAPPVFADLVTRSAFSELLAIPAAWWLLDRKADSGGWTTDAAAIALLWLVHAPTAVMVLLVLGVAALADGRERVAGLAASAAAAAAVTAWHWLPLADEMSWIGNRAALVGGIFVTRNNLLGARTPHDPALNAALSVAAVALLIVVLVEGWQRTDRRRAALITLCVGLTSPLAAPLWGDQSPLAWLQFPWRWLLPAFLLAIRPLAERTPFRNRRSWALALLWLTPVMLVPTPAIVRAPRLTADQGWKTAGAAVHAAIGGNPLLVDATQNRPPWYGELATQLPALGGADAVTAPPAGPVRVEEWRPLHRSVEVWALEPTTVVFRLLDYPWWEVAVDGQVAGAIREAGLLRVPVPAGNHRIEVAWRGNPWSRVGLAVALAGALVLLTVAVRRRQRRFPIVG